MSSQNDPTGPKDPGSASPEEFASSVQLASTRQLAEALDRPQLRATVLDEVFHRMSSRYRGEATVDGVIHWRILDRPGGGHDLYESVLANGTCSVHKRQTGEPRVTISLSGAEFLRLASGERSPTVMFFSGRLQLTGDIAFAAGLGHLFGVPTA